MKFIYRAAIILMPLAPLEAQLRILRSPQVLQSLLRVVVISLQVVIYLIPAH